MTSRPDIRPIALDVTAVSELNFTTGVQRVLREYLSVNRDNVELIRYDHKARIWRSIPELGELIERPRSGIAARVRQLAEKTTSAVVEEAKKPQVRAIFREIPFAGPIYDWLKKAKSRHLQAQKVSENYKLSEQPQWVPHEGQTYLLLDLPIDPAHALAMEDLFRRPGVNSLVFVHDLFPLSHRHLFDREHHHRARKLHLTYLDAVTQASAIVANSNFTLGQYRDFRKLVVTSARENQKQSVVLLPWPRMTSEVAPDSSVATELFGNAAIKVLLVGQLDQRKNFQVVVRAVKSLIDDGVDARLGILAGYSTLTDPVLREALESCSTEQRSRITTHGIVSDAELVGVYDAATVVAVPSVAEGFGLPVIESLSRGKRVVAADSSALTELGDLFGSDRVKIAPHNDPVEWASRIVEIAKLSPLKAFRVPKTIPTDWSDFHARIIRAASR